MGLLSKLKKAVHKIDPVAKATDKLRGKVHDAGNKLAVKATSATLGKKAGATLAGALEKGDALHGISSGKARPAAKQGTTMSAGGTGPSVSARMRPATPVNPTGGAGAKSGLGRLGQARGSFNKKNY